MSMISKMVNTTIPGNTLIVPCIDIDIESIDP